MKRKTIAIAIAGVLFQGTAAHAHVSDAEWEAFKADFAAMAMRVNALEAENASLKSRGTVTVEDLDPLRADVQRLSDAKDKVSWAEKLKWNGDFRYRYEDIQEDGKSDRDRNRVRARAGLKANPGENVVVGLGMATGGDDPVSTNQTLGGGGSTKDVRLDLAYFTWTGIEGMYVTAGKYSNPFYRVQKSGLIWDGDFRPEGLALGWANDMFFATASYSFIESDSKNDDDGIWGVQVGSNLSLGESMQLTASVKYLDIPTKGRAAIYDDDFFGNSSVMVGGDEVYAYNYELVNASVELAFALGDFPVSIYSDFVRNEDADDLENGYIAGVKLGKAKAKGSWQVQYQYQVLEADSVLGLVTDSDFAGGGSDGEGHKFSAKYAIDSKWYVGATYFDTNRGVDLGSDADYKRLQIDTGFKY